MAKRTRMINNNIVNKEGTKMENAEVVQETVATEVTPEQINVPTPPAQGEVQEATPEKPKKKGLLKKILIVLGAILALFTSGFLAGRVTGNKCDEYDDPGEGQQPEDNQVG